MDTSGNGNWVGLKGKPDTCKKRIEEIKIRKFGESQRDMIIIYLKSGHEV